MNNFTLFFNLGIDHISNLDSTDHILFLITLCGVYMYTQWRQILVLITAFTIGHTLSLSAATFDVISAPANIIEFLIPLTILITSLGNLFSPAGINSSGRKFKYVLALIFGLIHGMGYLSRIKMLLEEGNKIIPLFSFNLGVEVGQIIVVLSIILVAAIFTTLFKVSQRDWNLVISGAGIGVSSIMVLERWIF